MTIFLGPGQTGQTSPTAPSPAGVGPGSRLEPASLESAGAMTTLRYARKKSVKKQIQKEHVVRIWLMLQRLWR